MSQHVENLSDATLASARAAVLRDLLQTAPYEPVDTPRDVALTPIVPSVTGAWPEGDLLPKLRAAALEYESRGKELLNKNPLESLLALVLGGAAVYYAAERGKNEKVHTYWDALEFVSTCASVGYSNIFPNTPLGKIVASTLFLLGPNLSARALDPLPPEQPAANPGAPDTQALLVRLDAILDELRRTNG